MSMDYSALAVSETGRVTLNGRLYDVQHHWGHAAVDGGHVRISQVAVDSAARLHLLRRARAAVVVLDPGGQFLFGYGEGQIFDPHGITIDHLDRVWIADRDAHQVLCFSSDGAPLSSLGKRHTPRWRAPFNHPTKVAVSADGEIYVADGYGNGQIHRFDPAGGYLASFGEIGHHQGAFMTPHSLIVDQSDRVLVCDRENDRVQVFDRDGHWLASWEGLSRPMDIFEQVDGTFIVTDRVPSITSFAANGDRLGRCRPSLHGAHGISGDRNGNLYLAENETMSVTRLTEVQG
jgi:DNA-binding beta-propeller fold protein YncE